MGRESLHENGNKNDVRVENFATPKNLIVKSTMYLHQNTPDTWTFPDGLKFRMITSWQTRDGIHTYLVSDFSRELTANCKFWGQTVSMYVSISEVWYGETQTEEPEQGGNYRRHLQIENLDDNMGINRACRNIWGNIKISAKESLGQYKHKSFVRWRMCKFVQWKQPNCCMVTGPKPY